MLKISPTLAIPLEEIRISAVRSQGAGGQNVNKVASAVHLRFDVAASSLPPEVKERVRALPDRRITEDGVIIIKAQQFRTREKNRDDALDRLAGLIRQALVKRKARRPTKPTRGSNERRLDTKKKAGQAKNLRQRVKHEG